LLVAVVSLRKCERDRADGQEEKKVKRTSNQVRFDGGVNLFFHGSVVRIDTEAAPRCANAVLRRDRGVMCSRGLVFRKIQGWSTLVFEASSRCQHLFTTFSKDLEEMSGAALARCPGRSCVRWNALSLTRCLRAFCHLISLRLRRSVCHRLRRSRSTLEGRSLMRLTEPHLQRTNDHRA
jgi:hypothetical protein